MYHSIAGQPSGLKLVQTAALATQASYDEWRAFTLELLRDLGSASFSDPAPVIELDIIASAAADAPVQRKAVTIMALFRTDLFVSVTLPIVAIAAGAYAFTWSTFTRLDDAVISVRDSVHSIEKLQAVSSEQLTQLTEGQDKAAAKLDRMAEQLNQVSATLLVVRNRTDPQQ